MITDFELLDGPWEAVGHLAAPVRIAVFVDEQRVPRTLEWDGADETALHVVAMAPNGDAVATARLLPDGHVGRMAVLHEWRGIGLGRLIMERTVAVARRNGH
ncbi:MAG TPA: GNAT family N-acetyltransferase, partial [Gammaproteobacteria bacterium]|nr:GNAT family N-acetyltransferase [Gammaproteobacteria bacterium]